MDSISTDVKDKMQVTFITMFIHESFIYALLSSPRLWPSSGQGLCLATMNPMERNTGAHLANAMNIINTERAINLPTSILTTD